jgi:hypothetical protein
MRPVELTLNAIPGNSLFGIPLILVAKNENDQPANLLLEQSTVAPPLYEFGRNFAPARKA